MLSRPNGVKLREGRAVRTPNDNLNFNWKLIKAPVFVVDYIIVHELARLLEQNHTAHFWNIVQAQVLTKNQDVGFSSER